MILVVTPGMEPVWRLPNQMERLLILLDLY